MTSTTTKNFLSFPVNLLRQHQVCFPLDQRNIRGRRSTSQEPRTRSEWWSPPSCTGWSRIQRRFFQPRPISQGPRQLPRRAAAKWWAVCYDQNLSSQPWHFMRLQSNTTDKPHTLSYSPLKRFRAQLSSQERPLLGPV